MSKGNLLQVDDSSSPFAPQWVHAGTYSYTDFPSASPFADAVIWTLPAKGVIHACKFIINTTFSGGSLSGYSFNVGPAGGSATKYHTLTSVFTGADQYPDPQNLIGDESSGSAVDIEAAAKATGGVINDATQGEIQFLFLVSLLP